MLKGNPVLLFNIAQFAKIVILLQTTITIVLNGNSNISPFHKLRIRRLLLV